MDDFDGRRPDGFEIVLLAEAYAEMLRLLVEVLEAQSTALDAEGFSADEYAWVRWEVLRAAGYDGVEADVDGFVGALTGDGGVTVGPRPVATPVPEANRALVERYREALEETAVRPHGAMSAARGQTPVSRADARTDTRVRRRRHPRMRRARDLAARLTAAAAARRAGRRARSARWRSPAAAR
jgi:hypothetical protein